MSTRYVWEQRSIGTAYEESTFTTGTTASEYEYYPSAGKLHYAICGTGYQINGGKYSLTGAVDYSQGRDATVYPYLLTMPEMTDLNYLSATSDHLYFNNGNSPANWVHEILSTTNPGTSFRFRLSKTLDFNSDYYITQKSLVGRAAAGDFIKNVSNSSSSKYPSNGVSGDNWYVYKGSDSIDPTSVSYSTNAPQGGSTITVSVTPARSTYGGTVQYQYQYSLNGTNFYSILVGNSYWTTSTTISVTVPDGATGYQIRARAMDDGGFMSTDYAYGSFLTVVIPAAGISLNKTSITLIKGQSETLVATVTPSNATDRTVSWSSSDRYIVSVNNGEVSGVDSGIAVITATNSAGQTADCTVTVEPALTADFGVNNIAREIDKMYFGVNGIAREVVAAYFGVNGIAREVF